MQRQFCRYIQRLPIAAKVWKGQLPRFPQGGPCSGIIQQRYFHARFLSNECQLCTWPYQRRRCVLQVDRLRLQPTLPIPPSKRLWVANQEASEHRQQLYLRSPWRRRSNFHGNVHRSKHFEGNRLTSRGRALSGNITLSDRPSYRKDFILTTLQTILLQSFLVKRYQQDSWVRFFTRPTFPPTGTLS